MTKIIRNKEIFNLKISWKIFFFVAFTLGALLINNNKQLYLPKYYVHRELKASNIFSDLIKKEEKKYWLDPSVNQAACHHPWYFPTISKMKYKKEKKNIFWLLHGLFVYFILQTFKLKFIIILLQQSEAAARISIWTSLEINPGSELQVQDSSWRKDSQQLGLLCPMSTSMLQKSSSGVRCIGRDQGQGWHPKNFRAGICSKTRRDFWDTMVNGRDCSKPA